MSSETRFAKRLSRAAAFVAIVWSIAATFVIFQVIALSGTDFALSRPDLFGELLLPRSVSESTTCERASRGEPAASARAEAFALGIAVGRAGIVRQYTLDANTRDALSSRVENFARDLEVMAPEPFVPVHMANANREFVEWLEADTRMTARQIAELHSSETCHLYKLGSVWGYTEMVKMSLPAERAVFGVEIQHYAERADVPEHLWRPMIAPISAPEGSPELETAVSGLTNGMLAFLVGAQ